MIVCSNKKDESKIFSSMKVVIAKVIANFMLWFVLKFNFTPILLLLNHGYLDVICLVSENQFASNLLLPNHMLLQMLSFCNFSCAMC